MAEPIDDERDEEWFKEVYGQEYTGPVRPANEISHDITSSKKRSMAETNAGELEEDDIPPDPNAVPTDFTSREAKVWEAKAKAIERNWKKKKEDELICRICGEYGHFSQGCPSTLGVNRKQGEVVEKVPVKDKRLKPRIIGTGGSTIQGIEKDTGCRLKLEDNIAAGNGSFFVRITGGSRAMVGKAVDAVKKLLDHVQRDRKPQGSYRSHQHGSHNHSSNVNTIGGGQAQPILNQPPHHDPPMPPYTAQDISYYDSGRHDNMELMNRIDGRRQWEGGNQNGSFTIAPYGHKGGDRTSSKGDFLHIKGEDMGPEIDAGYDQQSMPMTMEVLENKFVQEAMQLTKELNDSEDKENARHREAMREIQEQYQQKMVSLRTQQGKRREDFLRQEAQYRQQQYQQYHQPAQHSGPKYYDYDTGHSSGGFSNREQLGYVNSVDRNDGLAGSFGSFRSEGGYHNSSHSYRNSGYESAMLHPRNQGYDAGQYRY